MSKKSRREINHAISDASEALKKGLGTILLDLQNGIVPNKVNVSNLEALFDDYQQYLKDKANGRILTPEGLLFICKAYNYDKTKIGQHFLELLPTICAGRKPDSENAPNLLSEKC